MSFYPHYAHEPSSEDEWFACLAALARYLRSPEGCPWDREQTAADFSRHHEGEAAELRQAFESGDSAHAEEEFGDTFFTLLAAAAAAESEGRFTLQAALRKAHEKMIRRHEHVFGSEKAETAEDAIRIWNAVKAREKQPPPK